MDVTESPNISVLGDLLWDVFIPARHSIMPRPDSAIHVDSTSMSGLAPGGTTNVVAALFRSGIPRDSIHLIATVGDDFAGKALVEEASTFCQVHPTVISNCLTGHVICFLHENGERGMLVSPGASARIQPQHVPKDVLQQSKAFFMTGFFLINNNKKATLLHAVESLPRDCLVALDPGSASIIDKERQLIEELLSTKTDVFLPNENEFCTLMNCKKITKSIIDQFFTKYPRVQVLSVTLGDKGAITATRSAESIIKEPARNVTVIDTTGAGDAYAGGFLGTLLLKKDLHEATRVGIELSSQCIQYIGGHTYLKHYYRQIP